MVGPKHLVNKKHIPHETKWKMCGWNQTVKLHQRSKEE